MSCAVRATIAGECITAYNDLKLHKKHKYIIYKLSDDFKQILVEESSPDKDWEAFREKLINATSKNKAVRPHMRPLPLQTTDSQGCRARLARVPGTPCTTSNTLWPLETAYGTRRVLDPADCSTG